MSGLTNGEVIYILARYTSPLLLIGGNKNFRQIWPIYRKYKVVDAKIVNRDKPESGGLVREDQFEYWNPFLRENLGSNPIKYNTNDELIDWNNARTDHNPLITGYNSRTESGAFSGNGKSADFGVGAFIKIESATGILIYKSTSISVKFSQLKYSGNNPYSSSRIRLWIRVSGGSLSRDTGSLYWYHTTLNHMYLVPVNTSFTEETPGGPREVFFSSITAGQIIALRSTGGSTNVSLAEMLEMRLDRTIFNSGSSGDGGDSSGGSNTSSGVRGRSSGSESGSSTSSSSEVTVVTRIRGNYGFISGAQPEGNEPQMVQYYSFSTSSQPEVARHFFKPKPNELSYDNLGSEWTEIERAGRAPLLDWKNFRLMKVSFSFLVLPDDTYRTGAFGETADDGITLTIDDKLEQLRNMASRPFPVTLFGFDGLISNPNPYSFSEGSGVQFIISDLRISSMIRTPSGRINRATCEISLQELPIEYSQIITMPKLPLIGRDPSNPTTGPPTFGERLAKATDLLGKVG
jgi:hypothetical protein